AHAADSAQVRREFMYALEQHKRVVPVLLDDVELTPELAPIHAIDLRSAVSHKEPPKPEDGRMGEDGGIGRGAAAGAAAGAVGLVLPYPVFPVIFAALEQLKYVRDPNQVVREFARHFGAQVSEPESPLPT